MIHRYIKIHEPFDERWVYLEIPFDDVKDKLEVSFTFADISSYVYSSSLIFYYFINIKNKTDDSNNSLDASTLLNADSTHY